eukprot:gnl/TRDRNA2_/TRDRNA2_62121_c0_seq1.p1 gnl/TRDRNA2_/TRDRNA2_62121_c0~~gnl/TRDRNA2_/TRDRNA2_62121_c0_seq1.p1  ORF type:complete len:374 (+),score=37.62 gnl/TRDRNA2_/TRDRNA2_62121_c0_seq1:143-1264(+)
MCILTFISLLTFACAAAEDMLAAAAMGAASAASSGKAPLAFAFGPGGLLIPYYMGVAYQLRDIGLLDDSTPIGGTSAGAIAASVIAFGLEESTVRSATAAFLEDVRRGDQLKTAFRRQLESLIPDDIAERTRRRCLAIGYYEVFPSLKPHIVTSWNSKEDFIETILASCNFPFFFDKWPLVKCRDSWAIDGMFSVDGSRCGCPPLPASRTVNIIANQQNDPKFNISDIIQPGRQGFELPHDVDENWIWWQLSPVPRDKYTELIDVGRHHARVWALGQAGLSAWQRIKLSSMQWLNSESRKLISPRRRLIPVRLYSLERSGFVNRMALDRTFIVALIGIFTAVGATFAAVRFYHTSRVPSGEPLCVPSGEPLLA